MGPKEHDARVRAAGLGAVARACTYAVVKMHAACNWAQVLEGSIDSAHSSSLHSTDMPAARGGRLHRHRHGLAAAVDRQGAEAAVREPTSYGFRYAAIRKPIRESRDSPVRPHHAVHRAVHRADPAQRPVQPGADAGADRRREHACSTGSPGTRSEEGHRAGRVAAVLRRRGRRRSGSELPQEEQPRRTATCRIAKR